MLALGVGKEEVKYTTMVSRAKPEAFTYEDMRRLRQEVRRSFTLRGLGFLGAGMTAWAVPVLGPGVSLILPKLAAFFFSYRLFTLPVTLHFEAFAERLCIKRDLENHPELLRPVQTMLEDVRDINKDAKRVSSTGLTGRTPKPPS